MVAFISARPDPVVFTLPDVPFNRAADVSVDWDTGQPTVNGRVFRSLNGGAEVRLPGPDLSSGTRTEQGSARPDAHVRSPQGGQRSGARSEHRHDQEERAGRIHD